MCPWISPPFSILNPLRPAIVNVPRLAAGPSPSSLPIDAERGAVDKVAPPDVRITVTCSSTSSPSVLVCGGIGAIAREEGGGGGGGGGGAVITSVLPVKVTL